MMKKRPGFFSALSHKATIFRTAKDLSAACKFRALLTMQWMYQYHIFFTGEVSLLLRDVWERGRICREMLRRTLIVFVPMLFLRLFRHLDTHQLKLIQPVLLQCIRILAILTRPSSVMAVPEKLRLPATEIKHQARLTERRAKSADCRSNGNSVKRWRAENNVSDAAYPIQNTCSDLFMSLLFRVWSLPVSCSILPYHYNWLLQQIINFLWIFRKTP